MVVYVVLRICDAIIDNRNVQTGYGLLGIGSGNIVGIGFIVIVIVDGRIIEDVLQRIENGFAVGKDAIGKQKCVQEVDRQETQICVLAFVHVYVEEMRVRSMVLASITQKRTIATHGKKHCAYR